MAVSCRISSFKCLIRSCTTYLRLIYIHPSRFVQKGLNQYIYIYIPCMHILKFAPVYIGYIFLFLYLSLDASLLLQIWKCISCCTPMNPPMRRATINSMQKNNWSPSYKGWLGYVTMVRLIIYTVLVDCALKCV